MNLQLHAAKCPRHMLELRPPEDWLPPADPVRPRNIVLVACCKNKADMPLPAADLYVSDLFKKSLRFARSIAPDSHIRVLSAKHGLLRLDQTIEPYDERIKANQPRKSLWAQEIVTQLAEDFPRDDWYINQYVFLAGRAYVEPITRAGLNGKFVDALRGMMIGRRLSALKHCAEYMETYQ